MIHIYILSGNSLNWLDWTTILGTVLSFVGLLITLYLAFTTQNIKNKVKIIGNIKTFQKDKKTLVNELKSCKDIMGINQDNGVQDLTRIVRLLDEYSSFMSKDDLKNLKKLKKMLRGKKEINRNEMLLCVNHIIGFLELNIDVSYKNL